MSVFFLLNVPIVNEIINHFEIVTPIQRVSLILSLLNQYISMDSQDHPYIVSTTAC